MAPALDSADSTPPLSLEQQEALLSKAIAALKCKQYEAALPALQQLSNHATRHRYQIKAQMGLVRALTGLGNRPAAIAQCQSLLRSPDPQVQDWAKRTLADLGRLSQLF
ncbi:MAG: hypothetical protein HC816_12155, partial [Leptolyngbyaceae cyanobacterium RM1_1_2]|nr:hypothetical protein [Leptolyngbyaceae cyanobacterium RM1_1_2]